MEGKKSIWDEVKQIDLVDYLDSLGHQPKMVQNGDYWYLSPFRQEKTPSFKVNRNQNVWFDHGTGEGGTIIDLGVKLYNCTYQELLEKLTQGNSPNYAASVHRPLPEKPVNRLEILSVGRLQDPELARYLKDRAIAQDLAKQYCSEVDFKIGTRTYNAIGFPNQSGGYELRNKWFKGSSSPKDISLISSGTSSSKACVFEGFTDFLSALTISDPKFIDTVKDSNFLVLNSLAFVSRTIPLLRPFAEINLFLDNDNAGRDAKNRIQSQGIRFHDASAWYAKHKDVNEYLLLSASVKQQEALHPKPRSRLRR
jgi:hypothetical protein